MGYFSNGTEGEIYQEMYCFKCKHWTDEKGCPVWHIHLSYNYTAGKEAKEIMNELIERKGIENLKCTMFIKK